MNRTKLKNYAPQARRDFIQAMQDRAAFYGLTAKKIEPVVERGDVAVIAGRIHPRSVAKRRKQLEDRIQRQGFEQTMEALAYTWFNRLAAIRFMELHGYLDHGYRVLSHPEGKPTPEILERAEYVELPGLNKETVIDLKLAGNKEVDLYRLLLIAQCNALHRAMPFLFEKIDDETELLLPDNLLHSDSLIRKLVNEIDEEDWQEVEIIGWLYQFYISEKKGEVIGKVVASADIPAATQLFTPNWIVKYLVQNTLGRKWLATYPQSALRQKMQYYIEPAAQTPEVLEQLNAITPSSLNPEELTLLDPACGSGHILVEAYDLFKAIYHERGYQAKDIPALILQNNLFGLEIDDRAGQLASFALMMKARADDRHIFDSEAKPNILAFEDSQGMNAADITRALNAPINTEAMPRETLFEEMDEEKAGLFSKKAMAVNGHISQADIASLLALFENAKTFGSLIQVPSNLARKMSEIEQRLSDVQNYGDLTQLPAQVVKPLIRQAQLLAQRYDAVVANPPYMVSKYIEPKLKCFLNAAYSHSRHDLYSAFLSRGFDFVNSNCVAAMVAMHSWMFLSTFETFRNWLLDAKTILSIAHLGPRAFPSISGEIVQVAAMAILNQCLKKYRPTFFRLVDGDSDVKDAMLLNRKCMYSAIQQNDFSGIPGSPLLYWLPEAAVKAFHKATLIGSVAKPRKGFDTGSATAPYFRYWQELQETNIFRLGRTLSDCRWVEANKGGPFRKWYGNRENVVIFGNEGEELYTIEGANIRNKEDYFHPGITYSVVCSGNVSFRESSSESVFYQSGGTLRIDDDYERYYLLGIMNSKVSRYLLAALCQTMNYTVNDVARFPLPKGQVQKDVIVSLAKDAVHITSMDWNACELSWNFTIHPLLEVKSRSRTIELSFQKWSEAELSNFQRLRKIEERLNKIVNSAYGLEDALSFDVPDQQITLRRSEREEDIKRLLSYAIGCAMGRYNLDKPGLIYAHSGNQDFDASQYKTFRADEDGIIPLLEADWGIRDDAANRIVEFIGVAWLREHLEENLKFIANSLGPTNGEQPRDTIRRYFATGFYKHHLSMYKRRPIYWLFSSGKQRAFQCLVYLHRYHEGTLARMRTEHVIPLQGQIAARIEQLGGEKSKATSTSHRKKLQKEQDDLKRQEAELLTFEEKLKHAADQKISLDLDDGVKVNYGKFGGLLAESKAITGGQDDE